MTDMQDCLPGFEDVVFQKKCPRCGEMKSRDGFWVDRKRSDNCYCTCKECCKNGRQKPRVRTLCPVVNSAGERCGNFIKQQGFCGSHLSRLNRKGDVQADIPFKKVGPRGGGSIDNGYRRINGLREHRLVMEKILGRKLLPEENIHHVNGDRADNRPENLELWSTRQPRGQRVQDKLAWAWEIIALYEGLQIPSARESDSPCAPRPQDATISL
jgi:hypothetical protein